jgi:hypothetical protein
MKTSRGLALALSALGISAVPARAEVMHLGVEVSQHVTLKLGNSSSDAGCEDMDPKHLAFFRIAADGKQSETPYKVPSGYALVITDAQWGAQTLGGGSSLLVGREVVLVLSGGNSPVVFRSRGVLVESQDQAVNGSDQMTAGIVVWTDLPVCARMFQPVSWGGNAVELGQVILHGYLTKTEPIQF